MSHSGVEDLRQDDFRTAAKGAVTSLAGGAIGKAALLLAQLLVARMVGAEAFGLFSLGYAIEKVCEIVARLGLNSGGMRFVSLYRKDSPVELKGVVIAALAVSTLTSVATGAILYLLAPAISRGVFGKGELIESLRFFALVVPFSAGVTMTSSVLLGFHTTTRAVQIRDLIQPLSYIFLLIVWVWGMPELPHVISAYAVSHAVAFAMGIAFLAQHIPHLGGALAGVRSQIAPLVRYSLPLVFVGFIQYLLTWIDIFLLGYFRPAVDVGLYQAASQVALGLTLFLVAVNSIYAPMAAEAHRQDDLPRLSALFRSTTRWVCCLSVPAFVVLIVQAPAVLAVFGGEYADRGWPVLVLVACGQLVNCVTGGVGYTLIMTGRQKVELANVTLLLALNVGAGILLIPSLGAVGAAIAAAGTATLVNLVRVAQVYRWYRILPEIRGTWLLLLLAAGAVILASVEGRGAPSGAWALEKIVLILVTMAIGLKNFLHPAERRLVARHVDGLLRGVRR